MSEIVKLRRNPNGTFMVWSKRPDGSQGFYVPSATVYISVDFAGQGVDIPLAPCTISFKDPPDAETR